MSSDMPDETKSPAPPPPEGEPKPTAEQPATPGGVKATPSGSVQSETKTAPDKPARGPLPQLPLPRRNLLAAAPATPAAQACCCSCETCRSGAYAVGFADGREAQGRIWIGD